MCSAGRHFGGDGVGVDDNFDDGDGGGGFALRINATLHPVAHAHAQQCTAKRPDNASSLSPPADRHKHFRVGFTEGETERERERVRADHRGLRLRFIR